MQSEGDPLLKEYQVRGYPSTFLLSPENGVIHRNSELRGTRLISVLGKRLGVDDAELAKRVKAGNVLIKITAPKVASAKLYGEFTNKVPKPLYKLKVEEGAFQRGFNLEAGTYSIIIKYGQANSFRKTSYETEIEVTGEPGQVIEIKLED